MCSSDLKEDISNYDGFIIPGGWSYEDRIRAGVIAAKDPVLSKIKKEAAKGKPIVMINPEIVASSDEENIYEEGCLSIPEHFAEIKRPTSVQVRWLDRNGNEQEQEFDGLWSTCVQHEIDHLNGKLFIDYLGTIKRQLITRKMQKFKREMERKET